MNHGHYISQEFKDYQKETTKEENILSKTSDRAGFTRLAPDSSRHHKNQTDVVLMWFNERIVLKSGQVPVNLCY